MYRVIFNDYQLLPAGPQQIYDALAHAAVTTYDDVVLQLRNFIHIPPSPE